MNSPKKQPAPLFNKIGLDASLVRVLVIVILSYIGFFAVLIVIVGNVLGGIIATALFTVALFFVGKWDRTRIKKGFYWNELTRLPQLNYWNILWIVLSIFLCQAVLAIIATVFIPATDLLDDCPSLKDCLIHNITTRSIVIQIWISGALSFLFAGYIAVKLPNFKCWSPYRHAIVASLITICLSMALAFSAINSVTGGVGDETLGFIILGSLPGISFAALGVWITQKKPIQKLLSNRLANNFEVRQPAQVHSSQPHGKKKRGKHRKRKR